MSGLTAYETSMVHYFAQVLSSKSDMPLDDATEAVRDCILDELQTSSSRGLHLINVPMGKMMLGLEKPPNEHIARYVASIRSTEASRWAREGVREKDIVDWWDMGGVMHGAYVAFDNLFNGAQFLEAMRHERGSETVKEQADYANYWLRKHFALYGLGNDSTDETRPPEDRRLPNELRARVETWTLKARKEHPAQLAEAIQNHATYNSLCRYLVRERYL
ncbi:hypothetical protein [Arthrobacter sp. OAP107]|uniref:hypothetical protein n=1 Tax=Arthrobacter sp. OAP107 TaxID=3156445 RepID=UPI00339B8944